MSKIKIQGNASGTSVLTLTSPNSDTDRTITLPDSTTTLVGSDTAVVKDASGNVSVTGSLTANGGVDVPVSASYKMAGSTIVSYAGGVVTYKGLGGITDISSAGASGEVRVLTAGTVRLQIKSDGRGLSQFTAKAWVNFNGTGTVAIRDSHNVSSVTDNGVGAMTVNFSNTMANDDYAVSAGGGSDSSTPFSHIMNAYSMTTSSIRFHIVNAADQTKDREVNCVTVFGD
jgi:hypothetical protein